MRVTDKLHNDYRRYGMCQYLEIDTDHIFAVKRLHPWTSQIEVQYIMDAIEREI